MSNRKEIFLAISKFTGKVRDQRPAFDPRQEITSELEILRFLSILKVVRICIVHQKNLDDRVALCSFRTFIRTGKKVENKNCRNLAVQL